MRILLIVLVLYTAAFANWDEEILYFLLIDRFCNGDTTNDCGNNPQSHDLYLSEKMNTAALKTYQGGDLQGVIDKLPYLKSLGVTAIWLSPVYDNPDHDFNTWWPYHGYHPNDFFKVDEHFGDIALLKTLVAKAHALQLKVILDIVFNQAAPDHPWLAERPDWFHPHSGVDGSTSIRNWEDQHELENMEMAGLPDFAQENPEVYAFLHNMAVFWICETNCDGFRLDAVKHIPKSFWQKMNAEIRELTGKDFLLLGEVFSGNPEYVAGYQQCGFQSLFDIPMYYTIKRVFAQGGQINLLSEQLAQNRKLYADSVLLSTLIDNHDVARFSYWAGEHVNEKTKLALSFAWALNGMPMLYYGTEAILPGAAPENEHTGEGQDYLNRLCMPWQDLQTKHQDILQHIQRLNEIRKQSPCLQKGEMAEVYKDFGVYAFLKYCKNDYCFIILNNSSNEESRSIKLPQSVFPPGGIFTDELTNRQFIYNNCTLTINLPAFSSLYLHTSDYNIAAAQALPKQCEVALRLTKDFKMITFSYRHRSDVQSVHLAGDFNGWDPASHPLILAHGFWTIQLPLKQGKYRYKYVLNNSEWITDESAEAFERDPYGDKNSVIIVK